MSSLFLWVKQRVDPLRPSGTSPVRTGEGQGKKNTQLSIISQNSDLELFILSLPRPDGGGVERSETEGVPYCSMLQYDEHMQDAKSYRLSKRASAQAKHFSKPLRTDQSPPEGLLWWVLRRKQILNQRFRRQSPIGPYIADFYCHELRLVVEIDGSSHCGQQLDRDAQRDTWMRDQGILIVRIQASDVFENLRGVRQRIEQVMENQMGI